MAFVGGLIYLAIKKTSPTPPQNTVQNTTNTQTGIWQWFTGWTGFNSASLKNQTTNVTAISGLLGAISNAFGKNDGGANPGVSVGGSAAGGTASSGGGAGLPSGLSPVTSLFDTVFNNGNYGLNALNNFDVLAQNPSASATNATSTGVNGYNNSGLNFGF